MQGTRSATDEQRDLARDRYRRRLKAAATRGRIRHGGFKNAYTLVRRLR